MYFLYELNFYSSLVDVFLSVFSYDNAIKHVFQPCVICGYYRENLYIFSGLLLREDTHKKSVFFFVGPLTFYPPYPNGLVVHATSVFPKASQVENWNETEWIHNISSVGKCWLNIQQLFPYIKLHKLDAIMHSTHNIIQYLAPVFSISFYYPPPPHPPPGQSFVMKVKHFFLGSGEPSNQSFFLLSRYYWEHVKTKLQS